MPVADFLANLLLFWLLALLWVAYRRWRSSSIREKELARVISSIGPDVLMVINRSRIITMCNNAVTEMFGFEPDDVVGEKTEFLYFDRRVDPNSREIHDNLDKIGFHVGYASGKRKDGTTFPLEIITGSLRESPGAVILIRDITERKRLEQKLHEQSIRDELTGLRNRRGFFEAAAQQLKLAKRHKMAMFLLFADLDGMKTINDTLGHQMGDHALQQTAQSLRRTFRESDIIGRLGGDEFAVFGVQTDDTSVETASHRLEEQVSKFNEIEHRYKLAISTGSVHYDPESPCSFDDLLAQADKLMYRQKEERRQSRR